MQDSKNPRAITDDDMERLRYKIRTYPHLLEFNRIKYDGKRGNLIRAGHQRLRALELEGFTEIPEEWTVDISKLPKKDQEVFSLIDNIPDGHWDQDILQERYDAELLEDLGLPLVLPQDGETAADDDFDPTPRRKVHSKTGDVYELECLELGLKHRILCGDSTDLDAVLTLMAGAQADLVVTDPPYNVNYQGGTSEALTIDNDHMDDGDFRQFLDAAFGAMKKAVKPGASAYIFHADSEGENFRGSFSDAGFHLAQVLIWVKDRLVLGRQDYHWQHEPILYGWVEGADHGLFTPDKRRLVIDFQLAPEVEEGKTKVEALGKLFDAKSGGPVVDFILAKSPEYSPAHMPILYGWLPDPTNGTRTESRRP